MYSVVTMSYPKAMKSGNALKLRKGAWDSYEDTLLRQCIEKYGEGKWHLVPQRAGLNRCRKSCRLRWLNYLRPDIKRGDFSADEEDLMIRLHKLLGNRWSLIGGRLPGRTANDVKNYWNTNVQKKLITTKNNIQGKQASNNVGATSTATTTATNVIKPLPRTLTKGTSIPCYNLHPKNQMTFTSPDDNKNNTTKPTSLAAAAVPPNDNGIEWWKNLFVEIDIHGQGQDSSEGLKMASLSDLENLDAERSLIWETGESIAQATETNCLPEDDWSDIWDLLNQSDDIN